MNTFHDVNYRYELKFLLSAKYAEVLKYRMSLLMDQEEPSHTIDGKYYVRSLYFDDVYDTFYYEKINGLENRRKYRIRYYNLNKNYIVLELKGKSGVFTYKKQSVITEKEYEHIINKDYNEITVGERTVLKDFILECKQKNLIPSIIVDYTREVFTYPVADIRITFDANIASGRFDYDLFNKETLLFDVINKDEVIMEVKYNHDLPRIINDLLKTVPTTRIAMSKFASCKEKKEV